MSTKTTPPSRAQQASQALKEFIAQRKATVLKGKDMSFEVEDPYNNTYSCQKKSRKSTAYVFLPSLDHKNQWEPNHPECPERAQSCYDRLKEMNVLSRCEEITSKLEDLNSSTLLELAHSTEMINEFREICEKNLEEDAAKFDSVFFNNMSTFTAAQDAASMCATLAIAVAEGKHQNGFAIVRPPGHHACKDAQNGYCIFNNAVLAAESILTRELAKRIMIIDFDVHHGQGTQRHFYKRNDVLYFSIHRYEHGAFWPNLRESDADHIGDGPGFGYNINVPLNAVGLNDTDYMSIVTNILLPSAYEYNPDFILVSAGYDACIGCPEGEMNVTPAFYGHLITQLSGLANGKIVCLLEGGYCIESLSEGFLHTVRALLGDPCNKLLEIGKNIHPSVVDTINNVKNYLRPYCNWLNIDSVYCRENNLDYNPYDDHVVVQRYHGSAGVTPFPTRGYWPTIKPETKKFICQKIDYIKSRYLYQENRVGYVFEDIFLLHNSLSERLTPETPDRLKEIMKKLEEFELLERLVHVAVGTYSTERWLKNVHDTRYIEDVLECKNIQPRSDWYFNEHTSPCIKQVIAALFTLCDELHNKKITSGVAIVRPPGHHARKAAGSGFCFANNVAVAAIYMIEQLHYKRVLIIDFDVHHGDGTQDLTYDRKDIMYISIHRYDDGKFFPSTPTGNYTFIGTRIGTGYNVNIPFNNEKMEDIDYITVWTKIVMPLAYAYDPDVVIISAGFDAGINDKLGCYGVYPETFGHLIQMIKPLAPLILALEGGYNLETTSLSMAMCVKALLGDSLPMPKLGRTRQSTKDSINNVITVLKPYWSVLQVNKKLCTVQFTEAEEEFFRIMPKPPETKECGLEARTSSISIATSVSGEAITAAQEMVLVSPPEAESVDVTPNKSSEGLDVAAAADAAVVDERGDKTQPK